MKSKISAKTIQAINQMCSGAILTGAIPREEAAIVLESIKKTNTETDKPHLIRKKEFAALLGVSIRMLDIYHAEGKLQYHRIGKRAIRVDERELFNFINNKI